MNALARLITSLQRLNKITLGGCRFLTILLVGLITIIVCAGVFWRYVLNDALSWSEESAKFLMVWMVFTGAPIALAAGGHAAIDALPSALTPRLRQALYALIYTLVLLFVIVLIDQGWRFAWNARVQTTPTTGISMMYIFAAMPLGGLVMFFISLELLLKALLGISRPDAGVHPPEPQSSL